jgi:TPR repeat protein
MDAHTAAISKQDCTTSARTLGSDWESIAMKLDDFLRRPVIAALYALAPALLLAHPAMADVKTGVDAWSLGDFPAAVREWQPLADKGDADAQFNLGQAYKLGRGVPQDLTRAEMLYAKAAAQGHMQAGDNYGLLLFQRGQHAAALPYIRNAANRGDPRSQYLLGLAYFNADSVSKDWVRAYALENLASQAEAGGVALPQAKQALAQMDKYIPIEDRQKAMSLATDMAGQIEANRARQFAAADLGTPTAPPVGMAGSLTPAQPPKPQPAPRMAASMVAPPHAAPAPAPHAVAGGTWKIQLGAFGVASNADAQWAKVKGLPEVAGHPRQNAPSGKVTRLLATGYSEDAAHAACRKLSGAGLSCLPVRE